MLLEREERFTRVSPCLCITEKRKKKESRNIKKEKERNNWNNKQCIVYSRLEREFTSLFVICSCLSTTGLNRKRGTPFRFSFRPSSRRHVKIRWTTRMNINLRRTFSSWNWKSCLPLGRAYVFRFNAKYVQLSSNRALRRIESFNWPYTNLSEWKKNSVLTLYLRCEFLILPILLLRNNFIWIKLNFYSYFLFQLNLLTILNVWNYNIYLVRKRKSSFLLLQLFGPVLVLQQPSWRLLHPGTNRTHLKKRVLILVEKILIEPTPVLSPNLFFAIVAHVSIAPSLLILPWSINNTSKSNIIARGMIRR